MTTPPPPGNLEKTRLIDLLDKCRETQGLSRLWAMSQLRAYLQWQDQSTVVDEIATIWAVEDLNMIIGAGAPGQVYYAVLGKKARLAGLM